VCQFAIIYNIKQNEDNRRDELLKNALPFTIIILLLFLFSAFDRFSDEYISEEEARKYTGDVSFNIWMVEGVVCSGNQLFLNNNGPLS